MKTPLLHLLATAILAAPLHAQPAAGPPAWTNTAGVTIHGEFVRLDGQSVVILKDGKEFTIPFAKLNGDSIAQAQKLGAFTADILLHYDFSDASGDTVTDRSGKGNHGKLHGFSNNKSKSGDNAKSGWTSDGSLRFDGDNDYVSTPLPVTALGTGSFTLEATVSHSNAQSGFTAAIGVDTPSHNDPGAVNLTKMGAGFPNNPATALTVRYNGLSTIFINSTKPTDLCDGHLHHLAVVRDAEAAEIRIYFDHQLLERVEGLHGALNADKNPRNPCFRVGGAPFDKSPWPGLISEVRITKRALTPDQFLPNPNR